MIRRLLVLGLLLHHIEGVCKPFSAARETANEIVAGMLATTWAKDSRAAVERVAGYGAAAIERARKPRRLVRELPLVVDAVPSPSVNEEPAQAASHRPGAARRRTEAIAPVAPPVADWLIGRLFGAPPKAGPKTPVDRYR